MEIKILTFKTSRGESFVLGEQIPKGTVDDVGNKVETAGVYVSSVSSTQSAAGRVWLVKCTVLPSAAP